MDSDDPEFPGLDVEGSHDALSGEGTATQCDHAHELRRELEKYRMAHAHATKQAEDYKAALKATEGFLAMQKAKYASLQQAWQGAVHQASKYHSEVEALTLKVLRLQADAKERA